MLKVTKILMVLWLFICGSIGGCSVLLGGAGAAGAVEGNTVEEVMERNPELTREEAETMVAAGDAGAVIGGGMVAGFGVVGALVLWGVGMIPLLIAYLVFKPSGTNIQVQQVVGAAPPASQSTPRE
jgi:hypothetical protein